MAWTAPRTFTPEHVLTAAQLNTHLRDNLLETAPAKATGGGTYFVATGTNAIAERQAGSDRVSTSQSTTSTSFTDLATTGPSVTLTTGTKAFIAVYAKIENNTANITTLMSWAISGATTRAALDSTSAGNGAAANVNQRLAAFDMMSGGLNAGTNTFTAKYRVTSASTGTFADRFILVIPL